jgi:hypothetical protein
MNNPYDQFDSPATQPNPFDQFDAAAPTANPYDKFDPAPGQALDARQDELTPYNPSLGQRASQWIGDQFGMPARLQAQAQNTIAERDAGITPQQARDAVGGMSEAIPQFAGSAIHTATAGLVPNPAGDAQTGQGSLGEAAGSLTGFIAGAPMIAGKAVTSAVGLDALLAPSAGDGIVTGLAKAITHETAQQATAMAVQHIGDAINSQDATTAAEKEGKAALSGAGTGAVFGASGRLIPGDGVASWAARAAANQTGSAALDGKSPWADITNWSTMTPQDKAQAAFNAGLNVVFGRHSTPTFSGDGLPDVDTTGHIEAARAQADQVNQQMASSDAQSPIGDLAQEGRVVIATSQAEGTANDTLSGAGLPSVGSPVHVDTGDGNLRPGTVADAFAHTNSISGESLPGIHIAMDDGSSIKELGQTLQNAGVKIIPRDLQAEQDAAEAASAQNDAPPASDTAETPEATAAPAESISGPAAHIPELAAEPQALPAAQDVPATSPAVDGAPSPETAPAPATVSSPHEVGASPTPIVRTDGTPWQTEKSALTSAKQRPDLKENAFNVISVDGGFGLQPKDTVVEAPTAPEQSAPTDALQFLAKPPTGSEGDLQRTELPGGAAAFSNPETEGGRAKSEDYLNGIISRITGENKVSVKVVDHIDTGDGGEAAGAFIRRDNTIFVTHDSLEAMAGTAHHEVIHFMRESKILDGAAWNILAKKAETEYRQKYGIDDLYRPSIDAWRARGLSESAINDRLNEEAVAFAAADHSQGNLGATGIVGRALDTINRFVEALRNWRDGDGFQSARGTLDAIQRGDLAESKEPGKATDNEPPAFARISDDSTETTSSSWDKASGAVAKSVRDLDRSIADSRLGPRYATGKEMISNAGDVLRNITDNFLAHTAPMSMSTATARSRAIAKDFANSIRKAYWQSGQYDARLRAQFTPAERQSMWNTLDRASVVAQMAHTNGATRYEALLQGRGVLDTLPEKQRAVVDEMSQYAEGLWQKAQAAGMVQGQGLPLWTPRMAVVIGADGEFAPMKRDGSGGAPTLDDLGIGRNLVNTAQSLEKREQLTAEGSEAGSQEIDATAQLVRDIRVMPMAMSRLERAIAGQTLINHIVKLGAQTGMQTHSTGKAEGFFTLDHPAMTIYRYKTAEKATDGQADARILQNSKTADPTFALDKDGNPIVEKAPIYISKEFEGPLRAVLSTSPGPIYKAIMDLKSAAMSMIMFSPQIHLMVEYGRALPKTAMMPGLGSSIRVFSQGKAFIADHAGMREAIDGGYAPIGGHGGGGGGRDVGDLMRGDQIEPGQGPISRAVGGAVGMVGGQAAGDAVKTGLDKAGDFWHNTLLWDKISHLQAGLYVNMRDHYIADGYSRQAAVTMAAHEANRYAGALPAEAMGAAATKLANVGLFSRTFTFGNLGVMKDAVLGMPPDIRAQLTRDVGKTEADRASNKIRFEARKAVAVDMAMTVVGTAIAQTVANYAMGQSTDDQSKAMAARWHSVLTKPYGIAGSLYSILADNALSPAHDNEPGKQDKIKVGHEKDGTAIYANPTFGKLGNEFIHWLSSPKETAYGKASTLVKPVVEWANNDIGHGDGHRQQPLYPADAGNLRVAWALASHLVAAQLPTGALKAVGASGESLASGEAPKWRELSQILGPMIGTTFSHGAPGGEAEGEYYRAKNRADMAQAIAMPDIKAKIRAGDTTGAVKDMQDLGMSKTEILSTIKRQTSPGVTKSQAQGMARFGTDEEKAQFNADRQ